MKDVEKFEKFEDLKKSEMENVDFSNDNKNEIEEFIQLLVKNSRDEGTIMPISKE